MPRGALSVWVAGFGTAFGARIGSRPGQCNPILLIRFPRRTTPRNRSRGRDHMTLISAVVTRTAYGNRRSTQCRLLACPSDNGDSAHAALIGRDALPRVPLSTDRSSFEKEMGRASRCTAKSIGCALFII